MARSGWPAQAEAYRRGRDLDSDRLIMQVALSVAMV